MSTMPPGNESPPPASGTPAWSNMPDMARLPVPGNAEFAVYLIALIVAMFVCSSSRSETLDLRPSY